MAKVLVTGTSKGLGFATALTLARAGHTVYATMRDPVRSPALADIAATEGLPLHVSVMDVDSDESVAVGMARSISRLVRSTCWVTMRASREADRPKSCRLRIFAQSWRPITLEC